MSLSVRGKWDFTLGGCLLFLFFCPLVLFSILSLKNNKVHCILITTVICAQGIRTREQNSWENKKWLHDLSSFPCSALLCRFHVLPTSALILFFPFTSPTLSFWTPCLFLWDICRFLYIFGILTRRPRGGCSLSPVGPQRGLAFWALMCFFCPKNFLSYSVTPFFSCNGNIYLKFSNCSSLSSLLFKRNCIWFILSRF